MCGIAGILSVDINNVTRARLQSMTDAIHHRGPDGDSFYINHSGNVGFGHRRLSVIDLSNAGMQPMNYLDRYTITYNGEIYNYIENKKFFTEERIRFFRLTVIQKLF
jgi:asparagine synthase (glutamine-hydrolysing)